MKDARSPETDIDIVHKKTVDAMIAMNAAIRTMHLYPLSSAACTNAIDKAYRMLMPVLEQTEELIFAESEKRLLVCGQPLNEAEMQKPQIAAFLDLFLQFGIRQICITKGMEKGEFAKFLEITGTNPAKIREAGGMKKLISETGFLHVRTDDKIFVSQEKEQKQDSPVKQKVEIGQIYTPMVETLDSILDSENKNRVSKCLASSIVKKDEEFLTTVLVQKAVGDLGRQLFHHLIDEMDDSQFEKLVFRFRQMIGDEASAPKNSTDKEAIRDAIRNMLKTEKGKHLQTRLREKKSQEHEQKIRQAAHLRAGLDSILNDRDEPFKDQELMNFMPGAVDLLFAQNQNAAAEKLMDRMGDGLLSRDPEIREAVSRALSLIFRQSPKERRTRLVRRLSYNLSDWIKIESNVGPEYENICVCLKNLAQAMIRKQRMDECVHIVEALHTACGGKNPEHINRLPARDLVGELAAADVMEILMAEFMSNNAERRRQGSLILLFGKTGNVSHLDMVLPFLRDKDLRVRRECLNTVFLIGEDRREDIFLSLFPEADDQMKIDMVKFLGRMKSAKAVPVFLATLESRPLVSSGRRNALEESICMALGSIGTGDAVSALQNIADSGAKKRFMSRSSDAHRLKTIAEKALGMNAKSEQ